MCEHAVVSSAISKNNRLFLDTFGVMDIIHLDTSKRDIGMLDWFAKDENPGFRLGARLALIL